MTERIPSSNSGYDLVIGKSFPSISHTQKRGRSALLTDICSAILRHKYTKTSPPWQELAVSGALPGSLRPKTASNKWGHFKKKHSGIVDTAAVPHQAKGEITSLPGPMAPKKASPRKRTRVVMKVEDNEEEEVDESL